MDSKKNLKALAISSFPTVGNAGLKNFMSILGDKVFPVPTLIISGLGNMTGHQRFNLPFKAILEETLWMAQKHHFQIIVYTGYFNKAQQILETIDVIHHFQNQIRLVIVDPVSGDNGKPYVKPEIIEELPKLSALANWLLPNETELKLLLNLPMETSLENAVSQFKNRYSNSNLVVTGVKRNGQIGNYLMIEGEGQLIEHQFYSKHYSGTGDAFAALFMEFYLFQKLDAQVAVKKAGDQLANLIQQSIAVQSPAFDLIIHNYDG